MSLPSLLSKGITHVLVREIDSEIRQQGVHDELKIGVDLFADLYNTLAVTIRWSMVPLILRALREWKIPALNPMDGRIGDHLAG